MGVAEEEVEGVAEEAHGGTQETSMLRCSLEHGCMHVDGTMFALCQHHSDVPPPPLIRPIFDWSEVGEIFPPASSRVDYSLLYQVMGVKILRHYCKTGLWSGSATIRFIICVNLSHTI